MTYDKNQRYLLPPMGKMYNCPVIESRQLLWREYLDMISQILSNIIINTAHHHTRNSIVEANLTQLHFFIITECLWPRACDSWVENEIREWNSPSISISYEGAVAQRIWTDLRLSLLLATPTHREVFILTPTPYHTSVCKQCTWILLTGIWVANVSVKPSRSTRSESQQNSTLPEIPDWGSTLANFRIQNYTIVCSNRSSETVHRWWWWSSPVDIRHHHQP